MLRIFLSVLILAIPINASADRPNILWLSSEDNGPHIGAYGDKQADTPALDSLASQGTLYLNAWSTLPVCAPARTTIITGMYPASLGAEHMRSMVPIPDHIKLFPQYLREAGYYCTNNSKEDYNVPKGPEVWDESSRKAHWKNRADGQPFFAVFNFTITHESKIRLRPHTPVHDPADMKLPAYHPDTPEIRQDWAQYYDKMTEMDVMVAGALKELDDAGLTEDTIVMYWGDHGVGLPRGKRSASNSGVLVPMIVRIPEKYRDLMPQDFGINTTSDRLVSFLDLAPTLLKVAGLEIPDHMQGKPFVGATKLKEKDYLYGLRGRMDERFDRSRMLRDKRFIYIKNYMPHRPHGQKLEYQFKTPTTQVWYRLYEEGNLPPHQSYFWGPKVGEELYDLENDPDEINNLAHNPEYKSTLKRMRNELSKHERKIRDFGLVPEADMLELYADRIPYDIAQDKQAYDLKRIQKVAQMASNTDAFNPKLIGYLDDKDPTVRYWAATGVLIHRSNLDEIPLTELRPLLADISPSVRVVTAEILAQHGTPEDIDQALAVLLELSDTRNHDYITATFAINTIDYLGETAQPIYEDLSKLPSIKTENSSRTQNYPSRTLTRILSQ